MKSKLTTLAGVSRGKNIEIQEQSYFCYALYHVVNFHL